MNQRNPDSNNEEPPISHREVFSKLKYDLSKLNKVDDLDLMPPNILNAIDKARGMIPHPDDAKEDYQIDLLQTINQFRQRHAQLGYLDSSEIDGLIKIVRYLFPHIEIPNNPTPDFLLTSLDRKVANKQEDIMENYDQVSSAAKRVLKNSGLSSRRYMTLQNIAIKLAENDVLHNEASSISSTSPLNRIVQAIILFLDDVQDSNVLRIPGSEHFEERQLALAASFHDVSDFEDHIDILVDMFVQEYLKKKQEVQ